MLDIFHFLFILMAPKKVSCLVSDYEDLYLVIHNIDGAMMRSEKVQVILSMLGQIQGVHILASIDHINAPLSK